MMKNLNGVLDRPMQKATPPEDVDKQEWRHFSRGDSGHICCPCEPGELLASHGDLGRPCCPAEPGALFSYRGDSGLPCSPRASEAGGCRS